MAIEFSCPLGHELTAGDHQAGEEVSCPVCGRRATVPEPLPAAWDDAYRATPGWLQVVRWLALVLGLAAAYGAAPAVMHLKTQPSPAWVWIALLAATFEMLLVVWLLVTPDWATLRVVMLFYLLAAIGYGLVALRTAAALPGEPLPWGLESVRTWAPRWCASVLLVSFLGAYLCAHASVKWRRAFEVERRLKATRRKAP